LGQLILHPKDCRTAATEGSDETLEKEADAFAAEFLMPQHLFEKEWSETRGKDLVSRCPLRFSMR
jgi:Zn-dependent peptidase ImmA (M78 family)